MKRPLFASYGAIAAVTSLAATVLAACEPRELAFDVARLQAGAGLASANAPPAAARRPASERSRHLPAAAPARPHS